MKYLKIAILLLFISLFFTSLVFLAYIHYFKGYNVVNYDAYITVGNYTGINIGTDAIYFGTVKPGSQVTRVLQVVNGNRLSEIEVVATGSIAPMLMIRESKFVLQNNGAKEVNIVLSVPKAADMGQYSGEIFVVSRKA